MLGFPGCSESFFFSCGPAPSPHFFRLYFPRKVGQPPENKGFPPGSRIDIKIGDKSFSLHVEFPQVTGSGDTRNLQFQSHIDRGNPNRDVVGMATHAFVDGFRGAVFHPSDPGLDPQ